jgi:hypothetical protein
VFRIVRKAAFNSQERRRLYREARSFLKLRAARNRAAKEMRAQKRPEQHAEETRTAQVAGD